MRTTQVVSALRFPTPDAFELLWTVLMPRVRGVARRVLGGGRQITRPTSLADEGLMKLASGKFDASLAKRALLTVEQVGAAGATREELADLARVRLAKGGFRDQARKDLEARLDDEAEPLTLDELWELHLRELIREAPGALEPVLKNARNGRVRSSRTLKRASGAGSDEDPGELARGGSSETERVAARDVLDKVARLDGKHFKLGDAKFAVLLYRHERSGQATSPELARDFADRRGRRSEQTFLKYIQADIAIVQRQIDRMLKKQ